MHLTLDHEQQLRATRQFWDSAAATFDEQPDHGLRDTAVRAAWLERLSSWLPPAPASILDVGCGTGSLSVLLAELGYRVTGIDLSPAMVTHAEAKAAVARQQVTFMVMDAAQPQLVAQRFDAIICRHLLWALPDPAAALRCWIDLLTDGGRLVLIEGYWHTGAGLRASAIVAALPADLNSIIVQDLSDRPALWGDPVSDERYAVIATLRSPGV